jgi:hypothetical protein
MEVLADYSLAELRAQNLTPQQVNYAYTRIAFIDGVRLAPDDLRRLCTSKVPVYSGDEAFMEHTKNVLIANGWLPVYGNDMTGAIAAICRRVFDGSRCPYAVFTVFAGREPTLVEYTDLMRLAMLDRVHSRARVHMERGPLNNPFLDGFTSAEVLYLMYALYAHDLLYISRAGVDALTEDQAGRIFMALGFYGHGAFSSYVEFMKAAKNEFNNTRMPSFKEAAEAALEKSGRMAEGAAAVKQEEQPREEAKAREEEEKEAVASAERYGRAADEATAQYMRDHPERYGEDTKEGQDARRNEEEKLENNMRAPESERLVLRMCHLGQQYPSHRSILSLLLSIYLSRGLPKSIDEYLYYILTTEDSNNDHAPFLVSDLERFRTEGEARVRRVFRTYGTPERAPEGVNWAPVDFTMTFSHMSDK